ncbi:MAG TPA: glutamate mutase L [Anaerolineales bacterium]|nr:glutamate mutase L [Anaerolineales bacterium]
MATSLVDADTLLAIDVGTMMTRAFFFDAVASSYRFVALGEAPSTYGPPLNDASEGIRAAIDDLQSKTGRTFVNDDEMLISPALANGIGVDTVAATVSAVPPLRILAAGLLDDISVQSARNLASTIYAEIVDSISMNDRRKLSEKIDEILRQRPDLIIVAGGSENGASRSVIKLLDPIGLACYLMPERQRPTVLFAGNSGVAAEVRDALNALAIVATAPNLRPTLESEQLGPAEGELRSLFRKIHSARNPGLGELDAWTSGRLLPGATGFGRMIRFISKNDHRKAVLGVDVGASSTVIAAAHKGDLRQRIYSRLGVGQGLEGMLRQASLARIAGWLPFAASESTVRDYILDKLAHPHTIPMTAEDAAMELALAREVIRGAMLDMRTHIPATFPELRGGLLPAVEPLIVSGSVLAGAPNPGLAMLAILDALEPAGVTVVLADVNNLLPSLGAAAEINGILPVQVLESGVLKSLGTVIAPIGNARTGTLILRIRAALPSGEERKIDVKQGMLTTIPLEVGQRAELHLQPLLRYDVGLGGPGRGGTLKVVGGQMGVVIDARGRPLDLPDDRAKRLSTVQKWYAVMTSK